VREHIAHACGVDVVAIEASEVAGSTSDRRGREREREERQEDVVTAHAS
jgi:hypothetical protein